MEPPEFGGTVIGTVAHKCYSRQWPDFEGPSDLGNGYGASITLAALSGALLGAGHLADDEGPARRLGPAAGVPAFALAAATGLGRMEDRKHFLSDVLFGASVGLAIGLAVSDDGAQPARLAFEPSTRGAAIRYRF